MYVGVIIAKFVSTIYSKIGTYICMYKMKLNSKYPDKKRSGFFLMFHFVWFLLIIGVFNVTKRLMRRIQPEESCQVVASIFFNSPAHVNTIV